MLLYTLALCGASLLLPSTSQADVIRNVFHIQTSADNYLHNETVLDINGKDKSYGLNVDSIIPASKSEGGLVMINSTLFYDNGSDVVGIGLGPIYRQKLDTNTLYSVYGLLNYSSLQTDTKNSTLVLGSEIFGKHFDVHMNSYFPVQSDTETFNSVDYKLMGGSDIIVTRHFHLNYATELCVYSSISQFYEKNVTDKLSSSKLGINIANTTGRIKSLSLVVEMGNDDDVRYGANLAFSLHSISPYVLSSLNHAMLSAPKVIRTPVLGKVS